MNYFGIAQDPQKEKLANFFLLRTDNNTNINSYYNCLHNFQIYIDCVASKRGKRRRIKCIAISLKCSSTTTFNRRRCPSTR